MSFLRRLGWSRGRTLLVAGASWALGSAVVGACSGKVVGDAGGGAGDGLSCVELLAEDVTTPVAVRLVNHTAADLYFENPVVACGYEPYFRIYDPASQELRWDDSSPCSTRCQVGICTCTTTYTCSPFSVTRVVPGGAFATSWNGAYLKARTVPGSCLGCAGSPEELTCNGWTDPGSVALTFRSKGWTAMNCIDATCDCTPGPDGSCTSSGQAIPSGTALTATALLAPGGASLDLVFE